MGRIQKAAEGFLSLVGNKVGGREPTSLSDVVIPSVDMTQLLLGRQLASEGAISLTSAVGDTATVTVPDNEVWLLHQVSWEFAKTTNTDRMAVKVYLTKLPRSSDPINEIIILPSQESVPSSLQNNADCSRSAYFATPWVLTSGVEVIYEVTDRNLGNIPWAGKVGFYRLTA